MTTVAASGWVRVNRFRPCPVCGKPDWCLVSQDGKAAICARIESEKPVGNKGAGWLHMLDNSLPLPLPKPSADGRQIPKATPDVLDKAYRNLLSELSLSKGHRDSLNDRGLTDAEIQNLLYKTLSANRRCELVTRLQAKGIRLAGVPGFYLESGQWYLAGPAGMLIPVKDIKSRIIGLQIRCDSTENGSRYKWLSSRGYYAGCSPGTPIHVAKPAQEDSGEIWITEGPVKADIAVLKLRRVVLAIPGVGNWHGVIPIIRELKPARAIIAFDMDKLSNPVVNLHKDALIAYLIKRKILTFEADWDTEFKGLDDLLTGGQSCLR